MNTAAFIIATNHRLKWWFHYTLEDLSPEQLRYSAPEVDERPLMEVAMHAASVLLGYTAAIAGGRSAEDYPADRWPPGVARPTTAAEFMALLDSLLAQVDEAVVGLSDDALGREIAFSSGPQQAGDALSAALTHALTHVGAIEGIRAIGGFPLPPGY